MKEIKSKKKSITSKVTCSCNCKCSIDSAYSTPANFASSQASKYDLPCLCDCDNVNAMAVGRQLVS